MTNDLTRRNSNIAKGSISDVATNEGKSVGEVLSDIAAIILVDISGSMADYMSGGVSKWEHAKKAMENLQSTYAGKLAIVSFHTTPQLCIDGHIGEPTGGTQLATALDFVQSLTSMPGVKVIIISDGQPQDAYEALERAKLLTVEIDVIWIGEDNDLIGRDFMQSLATGAFHNKSESPALLGTTIAGLLGTPSSGVRESS